MAEGDARREAVRLGETLRSMLAKMDKSGRLEEATIAEEWPAVVGPAIADHTDISGLREGELLIAVDSPAWATELTAMAEHLRESLNSRTGKESVRAIRFNVSRRVGYRAAEHETRKSSRRRYGGDRVEPVPLTGPERRAVERSVLAISDPDLRDAALRATVADLEWKKGAESRNAAQRADGGL